MGERKMDTKNLSFRQSLFPLLAVLTTTLLVSCPFEHGSFPLCVEFDNAPVKQLTSPQQNVVFEDQGTIIVYEGSGCAESNKSGREDFIKVEQSLDIPAYATKATVFLNGWHLKYLHGDQHVAGLGTLIRNIKIDGRTLKWQAGGALSDKNFDNEYSWCYYYTVVAWNPSNINLTVDNKDGCVPPDPSEANYFMASNDGTTTALSSFPTFLQNPDFASSKTVAILPRGFGSRWSGGVDHELLQIGYNLDHSEIIIGNGKKYKKGEGVDVTPLPTPVPTPASSASQVDSGFVSWETYAIFKDDKTRRGYVFGELVSGLGGNDVRVLQPPFSILPNEDIGFFGGCVQGPSGVQTQEFVIENVPFNYAIPMLTGWSLVYECNDHHVTEIGIWIDEIQYNKNPGSPVGTLRYKLSSILRDDSQNNGYSVHKVTVLGLRPTAVVTPSQKSPDLVPFSPLGTDPTSFCRIEQDGKSLRVTVKNQGNADAGASKTTVTFGDTPFTLDTPALPEGGSVDLLFKVPAGCFSPDCSFKITVDSNNQVDELNNEGNNSVNGGCIG
jgi:hypothetical protein